MSITMKKDQKSTNADSDGKGISEADWKAMMEHKTTDSALSKGLGAVLCLAGGSAKTK